MLEHPFLKRADIMFTNYYSGSSYSGPSTLRLLQASCGHRPHKDIFMPIPSCNIAHQLASLGYSPEIRMNHTGAFDNYLTELKQLGGLQDAPFVNPKRFPITMESFDKSSIFSDYAILEDWLNTRTSEPEFTFYNTTSLHDGNQLNGFTGVSRNSYKQRLQTMLDDFNRLFNEIEESGKAVLVVMMEYEGTFYIRIKDGAWRPYDN